MGFGKQEQIIRAGDVVQIYDPKAVDGGVGVIVTIRNRGVGIVHFPIMNYQYDFSLDKQVGQLQMAIRPASDNVADISALLGHLEDETLTEVMVRSGLNLLVGEVLGSIKASPTAVISLLVDPD
ncbi:MAG: hypothetical protein V1487_03055 [bacterium]